MDAIKLLQYSRFLRHRYLDAFNRLGWDEFVKDRGASFDSLRNILLHCVEVLDRYVNHRIQGFPLPPRINFDDYTGMQSIRDYMQRVESEADRYFTKLTPGELSRRMQRRFKDGTVVELTVADMLIHLFQEEIHHTGEFIALLWQMGVEPPHLGWAKFLNIRKGA